MTVLDIVAANGISPWSVGIATVSLLAVSFWITSGLRHKQDGKEPDAFPDLLVPGIWNAYKFIFRNRDFLEHAKNTLNGRNIMKFWMGPQRVYLVTGSKNVQAVIRNSGHFTSDDLFLMTLPTIDNVTQKDLARFKADKSGRGHIPLDDTPEKDRIWAQNHRIFLDHLSSPSATATMTKKFCEILTQYLERRPKGEWQTVQLFKFMKQDVVEAAVISLAGREILKQNPRFIDAMWRFDAVLYPLIFGVPKFLYPKGYAVRDAFHKMGAKWLNYAFENYDWDSPDLDWDEMWGTRFIRTQAKFFKDKDFDLLSRSGLTLGSVWAQNGNTIPIATWAMIEVIKDKALFKALRAEATTAFDVDTTSNAKTLNPKRLLELPLLQSVYAECMRLHVFINLTRGLKGDMKLDGYALKKGSLVQSPSMLGHLDPEFWSKPNHPATEFWAERFITYVDETDDSGVTKTAQKFSTTGIAGNWYPYGGGISICAGRHFAKQEIMATIALLVVHFDMELVQYVHMDGSKSDRGPKDDPWWCGTAAMPPDRDLKIRWKRV